MQFSGLSAKTVNCQRKITCCITYKSSENSNLLQFKNIYPVVKLSSAGFQKTISNKPCSGIKRYCGGSSETEQHQHCKTDEWSAGWGAPGCRVSCAKPGTDHHHSCGARLQLQQHATVSATVVLAAPSQLIDSLFTENKELYSGDVMVLPVSKRCANLLICCHVWLQVLTWWVPERVSTITWPPNLIPGAGEFGVHHLPENH